MFINPIMNRLDASGCNDPMLERAWELVALAEPSHEQTLEFSDIIAALQMNHPE